MSCRFGTDPSSRIIQNTYSGYSVFGRRLETCEQLRLAPAVLGQFDLRYDVCWSEKPREWEHAQVVYQSAALDEEGNPQFVIRGQDGQFRFCYSDIATFDLSQSSVVCYPCPDIPDETLNDLFLRNVLPLWIEFQGILALHASAIVTERGAVGFLSHSGNGKSSLAARLVVDGYPLLTDDILAVELQGGDFVAHPGYPYLKLWPPEAEHFLGHFEDLEQVHPELSKRWVPIGGKGLGTFCESTQRLNRLYVLERYPPCKDRDEIQIIPISPRDAVIELVRYSFAYPVVENVGLQPRRLDFFTQLARQVPIRRLRYPSGFEHLPRVQQAIVEDCNTIVTQP